MSLFLLERNQLEIRMDLLTSCAWVRRGALPETANVFLLLEDGQVSVAETSEERGTADASRSAAKQGDLAMIARWQLIDRRQARIAYLRYAHLHEHLHVTKQIEKQ